MLPDGVTHTKGFVKDPEEAKRYLTVMNGSDSSPGLQNHDKPWDVEKLEDRKRTDPTKNVMSHFIGKNCSRLWPCLMKVYPFPTGV